MVKLATGWIRCKKKKKVGSLDRRTRPRLVVVALGVRSFVETSESEGVSEGPLSPRTHASDAWHDPRGVENPTAADSGPQASDNSKV